MPLNPCKTLGHSPKLVTPCAPKYRLLAALSLAGKCAFLTITGP